MAEQLTESSSSPLPPPEDHLNSLSLQSPNDAIQNEQHENLVEEERENENENENVKEEREREKKRRTRFPVRSNVEDCSFYMRTGLCKFGMNCKFNHPHIRKSQGVNAKAKGKEEEVDSGVVNGKEKDVSLDNKQVKSDCKYLDRPGGCKYGKACKFNHSRKSSLTIELNFMGLPIRPGEKECPYYMRTGSCKYGAICRFNHPDPTSVGGSDAQPAYNNKSSMLSPNVSKSTMAPWSPPAALNERPSYLPLMFPPSQGVPSPPPWSSYQASVYPTERNMKMPPAHAMNGQLDTKVHTPRQEQSFGGEFPERPGQPECSYFVKTGNCKYRSACKFHHPNNMGAKSPSCTLNESGLPIRPGESVCSYFNRYGLCKYGPACKYDHSVQSAQSAPLPVSATDETPGLGDSVENDGAVAARPELEART